MNKHQIVELLKTNDKAIARALVVLNERQTADEQSSEHTRYHNGRGFRPCHARMGTSMAKFYLRNQYLSPKQIAYWRATMRDGKMRIEIYAGQLLEVAQAKATAKTAVQPAPAPAATDREQERAARYAEADRIDAAIAAAQPTPVANTGSDYGNDMERLMVLDEIYSDIQNSGNKAAINEVVNEINAIRRHWFPMLAPLKNV